MYVMKIGYGTVFRNTFHVF